MNPLQQLQAEWDAIPPAPPPPSTALSLAWLYALLIGFTALYLAEMLFAAWWRA